MSAALINLNPGFGVGTVVTVYCDVSPGTNYSDSPTNNSFLITDVVSAGTDGNAIDGLTLSASLSSQ